MPLTREQLDRELGSFSFVELPRRQLRLDPEWEETNLTYVDAPWRLLLGWGGYAARIRCHRRVARQLLAALRELRDRGLTELIKTYDGAYTPRLIRGGSAPSPHCWGHAIDLNAQEFPLGSDKKQNQKLVDIMERNGFECGQVWEGRKDPMHFEAIRFSAAESAPASTVDEIPIIVGNSPVATGRLEGGRVIGHLAPVVRALGHTATWDEPRRRLVID